MIFQNFTYKQKIIGLLVFSIILFFTAKKRSYMLAKNAYIQVKDVENKLNYIGSGNTNIEALKTEILYYDTLIGSQDITPEEIQQDLLDFSASIDNVDVVGIEEIHEAQTNGFNIITNRLVVEGDFNALLHFMYSLEKKLAVACITSVTFSKGDKFASNNKKTRIILTFQSYDKNKL